MTEGNVDVCDLRFFAFLIPQFHPIPENDNWWGRGFTEWTNATRAQPQFKGHYQPHLPADLGFYDLRLPETRIAQTELASAYGIDGFCYYHYWFGGKRLLERPFEEVLRSGQPDFPFMLCWANENWTRAWTGGEREVLMRQTYSHDDDLAHIRHLSEAFCDHRYAKVNGKPVFLVYRPSSLPDAQRTADTWRTEFARLTGSELYLCAVHSNTTERVDASRIGFDAAVEFQPDFSDLGTRLGRSPLHRGMQKFLRPQSALRHHRVHDYREFVARNLARPVPPLKRFPCVTPGFDNSSRRVKGGAVILVGSTPERYGEWLEQVVDRFEPYSADENFVFVNAWNEWAEGNHLEPDQRWGTAYLEAHAKVACGARGALEDGRTCS